MRWAAIRDSHFPPDPVINRRDLFAFALLLAASPVGTASAPPTTSVPSATSAASPGDAVFAHPATPARVLELTSRAADPLRKARVVRGTFVQRQRLQGLAKPLKSSGEFVFARDAGVVWTTLEPFPSRLVLSRDGLVQQQGEDIVRIEAAREPGVRFVAEIFLGLFALDIEALADDFELYAVSGPQGWTLGLKPRRAALRGVFEHAILTGDRQLDRVTLRHPRGDETRIELGELTYDDPPLSTEERRLFP